MNAYRIKWKSGSEETLWGFSLADAYAKNNIGPEKRRLVKAVNGIPVDRKPVGCLVHVGEFFNRAEVWYSDGYEEEFYIASNADLVRFQEIQWQVYREQH